MHSPLKHVLRLLLPSLLLVALAACGGNGSGVDSDLQGPRAAALAEETIDADWQAVLDDPGQPGVDYSPSRISISYRSGASLPRGLKQSKLPPAGQRAADQGNAILRKERAYEALTDAIAGRFGLRITNQVYMGRTAAAGFELPDGADGQAVIDSIRSEFGDAVEWVTFARLARPCYDPDDPEWGLSTDLGGAVWGLRKIGCQSAWDFSLGEQDIIVGVMDSGCNIQHEELVNTVINPEVTFPDVNCDLVNQNNTMEDFQGHGSGCVGVVACEADNTLSLVGGAPGCRVLPLKITNDWNDGTDMNVVEAGYLGQELGLRAISMSFGYGGFVPSIRNMCLDLDDAGILLIASSGNEDGDFELFPAVMQRVMGVGATNTADARISHEGFWGSNYGPTVDIAAPGEGYLSCAPGGPNFYQEFGGTSGSAPHVLAAAALCFSYFPTWNGQQVWDALVETGAPTTGFEHAVPRVDIGNLFDEFGISLILHPPARLLEHGAMTLNPEVNGRFDSIELLLNENSLQTKTSAPWNFNVDLAGLGFEPFTLRLNGLSDLESHEDVFTYWCDNSAPAFPFKEGLDSAETGMRVINPLLHARTLVEQLYLSEPTEPQNLLDNGPGEWQFHAEDSFAGDGCFYCGLPGGDDYGSYELDCLVSQALDLSKTATPTLSYYQRFNIEDGDADLDTGAVMVSKDYGLNWEPGALKDGAGPAVFSGFQPDWQRVDIDLSVYVGQTVHIAFVFSSDFEVSGENNAAPSGWWIDELNVSKSYQDNIGFFSSLGASTDLLGQIPSELQLGLSISGPVDVSQVVYTLDCLPYGNEGPEDKVVTSSQSPFSAQLFFTGTGFVNQVALLRARSVDAEGLSGFERSTPVYIFNHPGDVNADGLVDQADHDAFGPKMGLFEGQPGYVPFFDSNLDGRINEADCSAVGYFWSAGS